MLWQDGLQHLGGWTGVLMFDVFKQDLLTGKSTVSVRTKVNQLVLDTLPPVYTYHKLTLCISIIKSLPAYLCYEINDSL